MKTFYKPSVGFSKHVMYPCDDMLRYNSYRLGLYFCVLEFSKYHVYLLSGLSKVMVIWQRNRWL